MPEIKGAIAAGDKYTAMAGMEILEAGGNAYDAAIGAAFTSFFTESLLTSAAGGGFLMSHSKNGKNRLYDFFTQTPKFKDLNRSIDFYPVAFSFGEGIQEFNIGNGSMAVPGMIKGLFKAHSDLGKMPISEVLWPAIDMASKGVPVTKHLEFSYKLFENVIHANEASGELYYNGENLKKEHDIFNMPQYSAFLDFLGKEGPREFHEGEIAQKIGAHSQENGGFLTFADFRDYEVVIRNPLTYHYKGHRILFNPIPSLGGSLIAFALEMTKENDSTKSRFGNRQHLQQMAKALYLSDLARKNFLMSQKGLEKQFEELFSEQTLIQYREAILKAPFSHGNTTHISVMDNQGNAASITSSNGQGSGYMIPGTDIMMNNMLGETDLIPNGIHGWPLNERISSLMSPTIILKGENPIYTLGTGGANRIRTVMTQIIYNLLNLGMDVDKTVNAPRMHWTDNLLEIENGFEADYFKSMEAGFEWNLKEWSEQNMYFGGVNLVYQSEKGHLSGIGDPRRQGCFMLAK